MLDSLTNIEKERQHWMSHKS